MFWVFGTAYTLAWDYRPGVPQGEEAELRYAWHEKPFGSVFAHFVLRRKDCPVTLPPYIPPPGPSPSDQEAERPTCPGAMGRTTPLRGVASEAQPEIASPSEKHDPTATHSPGTVSQIALRRSTPRMCPRSPRIRRIWDFVTSLFTPITTTLYVSLPIALTRPLKALFVPVPQTMGGPMTVLWRAPDGRAPLALVIDTGS